MQQTVIVGDLTEDLANFAKSWDDRAVEWNKDNDHEPLVYFSLADVGLNQFVRLLLRADRIIYQNKSSWSNSSVMALTDNIIYLFGLYGHYDKISGFSFDQFVLETNLLHIKNFESDLRQQTFIQGLCSHAPDNFFGLTSHRRSIHRQLWVAGCSYAKGEGLTDSTQSYGYLVANHLQWSLTNIACGGSSIDFAFDQIMRSSIKSGDWIIWGITATQRYSWFEQKLFCHVKPGYIRRSEASQEQKNFWNRMLTDDSRLYLAQRQIQQAHSFCTKLGVNLVLIYHEAISLAEHVSEMKFFLSQYDDYIDINHCMFEKFGKKIDKRHHLDTAIDGLHPGPRTHRAWADILVEHIDRKIEQEEYLA